MTQVVLWSTVVLGVVGAVLGASFFGGLSTLRTLIVISFCGLLGIALALLGVNGEETPAPQQFAAPPPDPLPVPAPVPPRPAPKPAQPANNEWWNQTALPAAPPATQSARKAVPLADFDAHRAQIAQCPRCAGFELDLRRDGQVCSFTCRNPHCRNTWDWRPGTAWPPTVVRHNLTRAIPADEEHR
jgi:hypothetical protein